MEALQCVVEAPVWLNGWKVIIALNISTYVCMHVHLDEYLGSLLPRLGIARKGEAPYGMTG